MKDQIKIGSILISKPFIEDKRFEKTIILIIEHNINGTVGLILNKKTNTTLNNILQNDSNITINNGGPVDKNTLFFIHPYPQLIRNSKEIKDGLFLGGNIEDISKGLKSGAISKNLILFFTGYSGWEEEQLKSEIEDGSWILHDIELNKLTNNLNWSDVLIEINQEYEIWATAPSDFHLN